MVRIAISQAVFHAIAEPMPVGSVGYEAQRNEEGERLNGFRRTSWQSSRRCEGAGRTTATYHEA
jgi:hypothetical protein